MSVSWGELWLLRPAPKRGEHGNEPLRAWVVHLKEEDAPKGVEPLEWILLTNVPTTSRQQAWERVEWYECRPMIEELHKAQKTGCGMEQMQFTTRKALETGIAMLSVVAVPLLRLPDLARREDVEVRPASEVIDVEHVLCWAFGDSSSREGPEHAGIPVRVGAAGRTPRPTS